MAKTLLSKFNVSQPFVTAVPITDIETTENPRTHIPARGPNNSTVKRQEITDASNPSPIKPHAVKAVSPRTPHKPIKKTCLCLERKMVTQQSDQNHQEESEDVNKKNRLPTQIHNAVNAYRHAGNKNRCIYNQTRIQNPIADLVNSARPLEGLYRRICYSHVFLRYHRYRLPHAPRHLVKRTTAPAYSGCEGGRRT